MPRGFIIMTALPPTKGHVHLIDWAAAYMMSRFGPGHYLDVLITAPGGEPMSTYLRSQLLSHSVNATSGTRIKFHYEDNVDLPNAPGTDPDFWGKWQSFIFNKVGRFTIDDIVFSSEGYGKALAKVLGASHVLVNEQRDVVNVKATSVRNNPMLNFAHLPVPVQRVFRKTVTIFGAESTGKTTLAKSLATSYPWALGHFTPEWARPYLEAKESPETNDARMKVIVHGQRATEQAVKFQQDKPFIFRDTDLLSTIGYYRIYSGRRVSFPVELADLYIVCPSNIPFEPDPLRYGVDKREGSDEFWIALLDEYQANYVILNETTPEARLDEAYAHCADLFLKDPVWGYRRIDNE